MKKLFLLATVVLAFIGCKEDEGVQKNNQSDKISVLPESKEFDNKGGTVSVMITSTGEWTLGTKDNATYDWVRTDKTNGEDGDMIKFTVDANETEETRFAYYIFNCGTTKTEFKITSFAGEIQAPSITIDEKNIVRDYNSGSFNMIVRYSEGINYRDLQAIIPENATWLKHTMTLEGEENGTANMIFEYEKLEGLDTREVSFTINCNGVSVPVKMTQTPKAVIIPEFTLYNIGTEGGTLSINISANVEYNVEVIPAEEGENWLTDYIHINGKDSWNYSAYNGRREAIIRFTEVSPSGNTEPVVAEVKVIQANILISTVARMNNYRAIFNSDTGNKDVLKLGKNMTIEILIKPDAGSFSSNNTIIGIERRFLIRHSTKNNNGFWELVYAREAMDSNGGNYEVKIKGDLLTPDKWTHIAVTVDAATETITLYQDGEIKNTGEFYYDMKDIDLSETYIGNELKQEFALGYAYENSRFFRGQVSEARIWNRALTSEEINAENHFYTVSPNANGLVAYWKINDGKGSIFKDYTSNGNDLIGQTYTNSWNTKDFIWERVSLPE